MLCDRNKNENEVLRIQAYGYTILSKDTPRVARQSPPNRATVKRPARLHASLLLPWRFKHFGISAQSLYLNFLMKDDCLPQYSDFQIYIEMTSGWEFLCTHKRCKR